MGWHSLLQGIFPAQGLNLHLLCLLIGRWVLYPCAPWEGPTLSTHPAPISSSGSKLSLSHWVSCSACFWPKVTCLWRTGCRLNQDTERWRMEKQEAKSTRSFCVPEWGVSFTRSFPWWYWWTKAWPVGKNGPQSSWRRVPCLPLSSWKILICPFN